MHYEIILYLSKIMRFASMHDVKKQRQSLGFIASIVNRRENLYKSVATFFHKGYCASVPT
jgi:hypothetical protein